MMRIAVFPGSFDPITKGHEDIVRRALPLFDKIIVALGHNSSKNYFFDEDKRLNFLKATFSDLSNVEIDRYENLTADYCLKKGAKFILRGIRNSNDYEYEHTISNINKEIGDGLETVFLISDPNYSFISSTIVREILRTGRDVSKFIPEAVSEIIAGK
jgi:pantetheine-phosphate adenylyltransferase